ncbi:polyketide cyclase [Rheinheimera sp. SA_1]|uniref:nuclear transport factor 2 family protein n=1 Tax=Rheinheimera sp. SA_1 TaxID=1827365 RepID=UPI000800028B|nr:nuclear transport factor 2 family protein [Rheinheimera sp. SA_1]OBP14672.1 polyketide cyclase [Rheinheimera sp. SA_1]
MSAFTLPEPIAAYFEADTQGPDDVARCFTAQGIVKDNGQTHTGRDAIKAWKTESSTLYTYTNDPFSLALVDGVHVVCSHTVGTFPGSPIDLKLHFRLERGLIVSLEITL